MNAYRAHREIVPNTNLVALDSNQNTHGNWSSPDREDQVDLKILFARIWHNKWRIAACALLFAGLFLFIALLMEPRYAARSRMMLDPRQLQILTSKAVVSELSLSNPVVETQVAVMRSNILLREVVLALGTDYLSPIDPRNAPSTLQALGQRLSSIFGGGDSSGSELVSKPESPAFREKYAQEIKSSSSVVSAEVENTVTRDAGSSNEPVLSQPKDILLKKITEVERLALLLGQNIQVKQDGVSYAISIYAEDSDPRRAAKVANAVADQYLQQQRSRRRGTTKDATVLLQKQAEELRGEVEAAEERVEKYKADRLLLDGSGGEVIERQLAEISSQLAIARADRATAKARWDRVNELIQREGITAAARTLTSPVLVSFQEASGKLARQDAELATRYGANHPDRLRIAAELNRVEGDIKSEVDKIVATLRNELAVADIRSNSLSDSIRSLEDRLNKISSATIGLRQLEREAEAARGAYSSLLSRLKETQMQAELPGVEAILIDYAQPSNQPKSPPLKLLTALGGVFGLLVGFGGVFAAHMRAVGYIDKHALQYDTGLPVLAGLSRQPRFSRGSKFKQRVEAEQRREFRQFANALKLASSDGIKSLALTSPRLTDASPSVAQLLAETLAAEGERVLCVAATSSGEPQLFGAAQSVPRKSDASLADVFLGHVSLSDAVTPIKLRIEADGSDESVDEKDASPSKDAESEGLFSAGAVPVNVLDMIVDEGDLSASLNIVSSSQVRDFLDSIAEDYDVVIFDVPGVLDNTAAQTVAKACKLSVCQIKQSVSDREALHEALFRLRQSGADVVGLVMTISTTLQTRKKELIT